MMAPESAQSRGLEHVEAVLAWGAHMLNEHPLLVWLLSSYVICSVVAIVALALAVANGT